MSTTIIPGNIKQQMLPFLLNPSATLNQDGDGFKEKKCSPLYFTFRQNNTKMDSGKGILNFCPMSKDVKILFDKDLSYLLTYRYNKHNKHSPLLQVTFDQLLDNIPAIQIREYIPDTALEQSINFFVKLIKEVLSMFGDDGMISSGAKSMGKSDDANKPNEEQNDSIFKKLWNVTWFILKYVTGAETNGKNPGTNIATAATKEYEDFKNKCSFAKGAKHYALILLFPHMLYYKLQSCTTTGIYEIPCLKSDKKLYSSDGSAGWNTDDTLNSGFRFIPKSLTNIPVVGQLLGKMFGNIGISWIPWWDATKGNETPEPDVEITFDLFNNTNEASLYNFIFVNTLIPNNKWIQYGFFLHSSHIYDIKLEGYNRLFACTGKFEVAYDGVLRDPPPNWFSSNGPLASHINKNINSTNFLSQLKTKKLIKIPDIYKVKMTFSLLIPANFNNYLYTLVMNDNHIDSYKDKTYDKSMLADAMTNAFTGLLTGAKEAFTTGNSQAYVPTELQIKD